MYVNMCHLGRKNKELGSEVRVNSPAVCPVIPTPAGTLTSVGTHSADRKRRGDSDSLRSTRWGPTRQREGAIYRCHRHPSQHTYGREVGEAVFFAEGMPGRGPGSFWGAGDIPAWDAVVVAQTPGKGYSVHL